MRPRREPALMVCALLLLACHREKLVSERVAESGLTSASQSHAVVFTPEGPAPTPPRDPSDPILPSKGMPYAEARTMLLKQGLKLSSDARDNPSPDYPEVDCPKTWTICEGDFLFKDRDGWTYHILVSTEGDPPVVFTANFAHDVDGQPSIAPPEAPDIPKTAKLYGVARRQLLTLGYRPTRASAEPWKACAKAISSKGHIDCPDDVTLPEVANCSGTGLGRCQAYWLAPNGRVLTVLTMGEPQPGHIYYKSWATRAEMRDLPHGWRPRRQGRRMP